MKDSSEYTTINFEIDSGKLGADTDGSSVDLETEGAASSILLKDSVSRESFRRKETVIRASFALNIVLACIIVILGSLLSAGSHGDDTEESTAAAAACVAGLCLSEQCSGNGIYDNLLDKCDCFECYDGDMCSEDVSSSISLCPTVDVTAGDPRMFEGYWLQTEPSQAAMLEINPAWGVSYQAQEAEAALKEDIRRLHGMVGNIAIKDSDYIIVGSGSTHLLSAAIYAVAHLMAAADPSASPPDVYAEVPYYDAYTHIATYHESKLLGSFNPETSPVNASSAIELVTSPNNPSGEDREPEIEGSFRIYDRAYNWPHFVPMVGAAAVGESDLSLYTLSKMTGHAGTRLGWVIVQNATLAAAIQEYISISVVSIPHESVWRARAVLGHILDTQGEIFSYARDLLDSRWTIMKSLFEEVQSDGRFTYMPTYSGSDGDAYCNFFDQRTSRSLAYVWIQCNVAEDVAYVSSMDSARGGCDGLFLDAGIDGRPGAAYGVTGASAASFVRLELLMNDRTFDLLHERLLRLLFSVGPI
jgi:aspartate/methionine/tyrosine aminotransferase